MPKREKKKVVPREGMKECKRGLCREKRRKSVKEGCAGGRGIDAL